MRYAAVTATCLLAGPVLAHDGAGVTHEIVGGTIRHVLVEPAPAAAVETPVAVTAPEPDPVAVLPINNANTCSHLWEDIGLPVSHKDPSALLLNTPSGIISPSIVCHDQFITQYNSYTKNPDWVIERLSAETTEGSNTRPSTSFKPDPNLPDGTLSAVDNDYRGSGLARGHNAASADFKAEAAWMKDTFFFSNAVPQVQNGFNGGTWKELEEHVQDLAKSLKDGRSIYVITGPVDLPFGGEDIVIPAAQNACNQDIRLAGINRLQDHKVAVCDASDANPRAVCEHGVAVPAGLFKIIYEPRMDRAFGFVMSNEDHRKLKDRGISQTQYFEQWRASLDVIEDVTNMNFFPGKDTRWRNIHENSCPATRWRQ